MPACVSFNISDANADKVQPGLCVSGGGGAFRIIRINIFLRLGSWALRSPHHFRPLCQKGFVWWFLPGAPGCVPGCAEIDFNFIDGLRSKML